jgi:hypothetical protein
MADPDPRELTRALLDEVRRMAETALADPTRREVSKELIQLTLRIAESTTAYLGARLNNQRYDRDGKLVDLEEPPAAEQLQQDLLELHYHAIAFFELGSIGISPDARAHILRMHTTPARVTKAAKNEQKKEERRKLHVGIAAAIRRIAEERKMLLKGLLKDGERLSANLSDSPRRQRSFLTDAAATTNP